jgi:hypothetical protein
VGYAEVGIDVLSRTPNYSTNFRNFSMRFASRLAGAAALALAPMSYASGQNAGKTLAMDFNTTVSIQGMPDTGCAST